MVSYSKPSRRPVERNRDCNTWLEIEHLEADSVENWMLTNLDRTHFFLPGDRAQVRATLEIYIRARVGSVFEGVSVGTRRTAGLMNED